jgi:uncharacterized protein (TIGR03435 family)
MLATRRSSTRSRAIFAHVAVIVLSSWVLASSQTVAPPRLNTEFEVASIKPNRSGPGRSSSSMPPLGVFRAVNVTLRQLMVDAFGVRPFQIVSGPDWFDGERFDVLARTSDGAAPDQMRVMLQALLAERFGLVFHRQARDQPIYALVPARADRALGPALRRSECPDGCGMNTSTSNGSGTVQASGETMVRLAEWLGNVVDRVVIDRTGLAGTYDFEMRFTRDDAFGRTTTPPDAPSIFTALREQLGLTLASARGPVEFLVIDTVSQPSPD